MEVNAFIEHLRIKYNYSDELVSFLKKALPSIIDYYGEQRKDFIFEALDNCEIHVQKEKEDTEQYLNEYFCAEEEYNPPTMVAAGFHHDRLIKTDNGISKKSIVYLITNNLGIYRPFDFENKNYMSALIHELCHAIKGYGKLNIVGNQVITSSGLMKHYSIYDEKSGTFVETGSKNVGLEEALNSYDEVSIMSMITGKQFECTGYATMERLIAQILENNPDLASIIKKSQFSGGDEWIEYLGKENSDFLSEKFQDLVEITYSNLSADASKQMRFKIEKRFTAEYCLKLFAELKIDYETSKKIYEQAIKSQELLDMIQREKGKEIDRKLDQYVNIEQATNAMGDLGLYDEEEKKKKLEELYKEFEEYVEDNPEMSGSKKYK